MDTPNQIIAKKEPVSTPQLKMQVFHEAIYGGKELMTIVGIREKEVELRGDYSGGTHPHAAAGNDWHPIEGMFRLRKVCDQYLKYPTCPLPNVHCGYPDCEPYITRWGHYVDGLLQNEVVIQNKR